jgi:hypothetical protein
VKLVLSPLQRDRVYTLAENSDSVLAFSTGGCMPWVRDDVGQLTDWSSTTTHFGAASIEEGAYALFAGGLYVTSVGPISLLAANSGKRRAPFITNFST